MKTLAFFHKPDSSAAWGAVQQAAHWARRRGLRVLSSENGFSHDKGWCPEYVNQVRQEADLAVAVGGDGTLLGTARALIGWDRSVLGVNLGTLGFLTEVAARDLEAGLEAAVQGLGTVEERILLQVELLGSEVAPGVAFNDLVLSRGDAGQLITFDVFVDGQNVYRLRADGIIVCTPTGSTAYALAANGPILHPALRALALVPLNPHSLTARPITLPSACSVELVVQGAVSARAHCDGQPFGPLLGQGSRLKLSESKIPARLLHLPNYSLFKTLREKLSWSSALPD